MQQKLYWLDYDPVALAVLVIGHISNASSAIIPIFLPCRTRRKLAGC